MKGGAGRVYVMSLSVAEAHTGFYFSIFSVPHESVIL